MAVGTNLIHQILCSSEFVSALLGSLIGASVSIVVLFLQSLESKTNATFALFKEFNSYEMGKSRSNAYNFIRINSNKTFLELDSLSDPAVPDLWQIMRFYQNLAVYIKNNQIKLDIVPQLFGESFVSWYVVLFKPALIDPNTGWQSAQEIQYIYEWLQNRVDKLTFERWQEIATNLKNSANSL